MTFARTPPSRIMLTGPISAVVLGFLLGSWASTTSALASPVSPHQNNMGFTSATRSASVRVNSAEADCPTRGERNFRDCCPPVTALASYPGSGNTWLRYLLEQATGKGFDVINHFVIDVKPRWCAIDRRPWSIVCLSSAASTEHKNCHPSRSDDSSFCHGAYNQQAPWFCLFR